MPNFDWDADIRAVFPNWKTEAILEAWPAIRESLAVGQAVSGTVISLAPFGVWLDIGVGQPALLLIVNMDGAGVRRITFEDFPEKGTVLEARINALGETGEIGLAQQNPDRMIECEPPK